MITTERRHPPQRAMAWRAAPKEQVRTVVHYEGLALFALLLPIALGCLIVATLRRDAGEVSSPLVPVLGLSVACAAALIYSIDSRRRERPARTAARIYTTVQPNLVASVAIACSLTAAVLTTQELWPLEAVVVWVAGLAVLLGHAMYLERPRLHVPTPIDAGALILLIALALLLRLPYLANLPAFVHYDEAQMGLYTRLAFHGAMPSLFATTTWWSVPWLGPALQAPLLLVFGDGANGLRLGSVIAGVLAMAGLWFLGSELWSRRAGFVAALLFTVLAPSIHFSRDGIHYMQAIAALVWTVLCYTRATKRYSGAYAALTGILIGVDFQLYYAARLAIPLIFAHAALRALMERGLLHNWLRLILWTALGFAASIIPAAAYYIAHPSAFGQRTDAVMIFAQTPTVRAYLHEDYGGLGWLSILGGQVQRVVLGFLSLGDRSEQYGANLPLLDPISASLVPAALAVAIARIRQSQWLLCILWAAITLVLGGILTTQQPDAPRLLAALPVACLVIGGLAESLLAAAGATGLRDAKPLLAIALAGSLVGAGVLNTNSYFDQYPTVAADQPVTLITDIGRYLSTANPNTPVVLYDHREFYLAHWSIRLLAPSIQGATVWSKKGVTSTLRNLHGSFFFVSVDREVSTIENVMRNYPGGTIQRVPVHDSRHVVLTYRYSAPNSPAPKAGAAKTQVSWRPPRKAQNPLSLGWVSISS
jgi:4-amino-4-deoxy-L-arabinose transferase-like glycosyltransferase